MKIALFFVIGLMMVVSCSKKKQMEENPYTISGYIYKISDSTPYANTSFVFYDKQNGSKVLPVKSDRKVTPFTTGENGYFSTTVVLLPHSSELYICWPEDPSQDGAITGVNIKANINYKLHLDTIYAP